LAQWKPPTHIKRLLDQLATPDDEGARAAAAKELGRHGHPAAISPLIEAIDDTDWYVANLALKALADIGDPVALPDVARRTGAFHPAVYATAAEACRALAAADRKEFADAWKLVDTQAVVDQIVKALTKIPKEESRVTAGFRIDLIEALVLLEARDAVPAIRTLLEARDEAVQAAAQAAIDKLTAPAVAGTPPPEKPEPEAPEKPAPKPQPPEKPEPPGPQPEEPDNPGKTERPAPPMPKPEPRPKAPDADALAATVEASPDDKAVALRLPFKHGLSQGDRVRLAAGDRPIAVVQITRTDGTRVVATIVKLLDKAPPAPDTEVTLTRTK
ncbi:MAG: HEAT repeat domain-containing protein, partial [Planctomycetota bacterium]